MRISVNRISASEGGKKVRQSSERRKKREDEKAMGGSDLKTRLLHSDLIYLRSILVTTSTWCSSNRLGRN